MVLTREENCLGAETKLPKGVPIATLLPKFKTQTLIFVVTTTHTHTHRAIHRAKTPNSSQKGLRGWGCSLGRQQGRSGTRGTGTGGVGEGAGGTGGCATGSPANPRWERIEIELPGCPHHYKQQRWSWTCVSISKARLSRSTQILRGFLSPMRPGPVLTAGPNCNQPPGFLGSASPNPGALLRAPSFPQPHRSQQPRRQHRSTPGGSQACRDPPAERK